VASTALTHDPKGNLTQDNDALQYAWDFDNMLEQAIVSTATGRG
jgi:hypothetical protein